MKRSSVILALVILGAVTVLVLIRDRTPAMTRVSLEAARRTWSELAIDDYTVTVRKDADALGSERIVTEVRDGVATRLVLDGTALEPRPTYSVAGLFETIERELELRDAPAVTAGAPRHAVLKGSFHETLGLPMVFKRFASERRSYLLAIEQFEVPDRGVIFTAD